jgi:hypothetical protein
MKPTRVVALEPATRIAAPSYVSGAPVSHQPSPAGCSGRASSPCLSNRRKRQLERWERRLLETVQQRILLLRMMMMIQALLFTTLSL